MTRRRTAPVVLLAVALTGAAPLVPASAATTRYENCTEYRKAYPHGVGLRTATDRTSGRPVTTFRKDDAEFRRAMAANSDLDRDQDRIACEKR